VISVRWVGAGGGSCFRCNCNAVALLPSMGKGDCMCGVQKGFAVAGSPCKPELVPNCLTAMLKYVLLQCHCCYLVGLLKGVQHGWLAGVEAEDDSDDEDSAEEDEGPAGRARSRASGGPASVHSHRSGKSHNAAGSHR
jgi:hypothetical protein